MLTSVIIKEMQMETTMRYITSYLLGCLLSQKASVGEDVKKSEHSHTVLGMPNDANVMENNMEVPPKMKNRT